MEKEVKIVITGDSTSAVAASTNAAAAQEALTNTGKGLATGVPDLDASVKEYVITTEKEYIAVQKAHDAITAKIRSIASYGNPS